MFLKDSQINEASGDAREPPLDGERLQINHLRDTFVLPHYTPLMLFVDNATALDAEPARLRRAEMLVAEFERQPQSLGAEFTSFWLRDFVRFVSRALRRRSPP